MYIPKRYGESKIDACPFCGRQVTTTNQQEIPVCVKHQQSLMNEMKCICGEYLETRTGKFGMYFHCPRCGNVNKRKVFEINTVKEVNSNNNSEVKERAEPIKNNSQPKEITITSKDAEWFE